MNGIFPADLAVYLLLAPIVFYIFFAHRWTGFLPWYYLSVFCLARIIGGILGVHDSNGLAANIIQSVGLTPLLLAVDGLVHEGRVYRNPSQSQFLGWSVVIATTTMMGAALALVITGSLHIFEGHPSPVAIRNGKGLKGAPGYHGGTALIQGAFVALIFLGVRVLYGIVSVFTQRRNLSPIYGSLAVRVVLMFLPEVFSALAMIVVGIRTRHLRGD